MILVVFKFVPNIGFNKYNINISPKYLAQGKNSDENRKEFWENKKKVLGQLVEIRADAVTQSQEEEHFSLRFPRFKTFRGFSVGEKW